MAFSFLLCMHKHAKVSMEELLLHMVMMSEKGLGRWLSEWWASWTNMRTWVPFLASTWKARYVPDEVVYTFNLSTWEAVSSRTAWHHSEFQDNQNYIVRPCLQSGGKARHSGMLSNPSSRGNEDRRTTGACYQPVELHQWVPDSVKPHLKK